MDPMKKRHQFCGSLGALLTVACLIATVILTNAKDEPVKCGESFDKPTGSIHVSDFTNVNSCIINIEPKANKGSENTYLFIENLELHKDDVMVITEYMEPDETLFQVPHSLDGVTPIITGALNITIQINLTAVNYTRDVEIFYQTQKCVFSNIAEEVRMFASPVYAKNITEAVECEYIIDQNLKKNASYVFIFKKYDVSSKSSFSVEGTNPIELSQSGSKLPLDLFSTSKQVTFTMKFDPNSPEDKVLIRKENLVGECTSYVSVHGKDKWGSPKIEEVPAGVSGECRWAFSSSDGKPLGVEFTAVNFTDKLDIVSITNGGYSDVMPFYQVTAVSQDQALTRKIRTSGSKIMISFRPVSFMASSLNFTVFNADQSMYMMDNGSIVARGIPTSPNDTIFLLEVKKGQSVLLQFKSSSLDKSSVLRIYDDFTTDSNLIAALKGNVWYPVLSTTTKMMVHAVNFGQGSFNADFRGTAKGCMHMSPGTSDSYILSGNCNSTCAWIIPPLEKKNELQLDLQYIALEPSDNVIVRRLDSNKSIVANITSGTTRVPTFSLDSTVGAYVEVTRGTCQKAGEIVLVAQATYLPDCSKNFTLSPYNSMQLMSPSYPNMYPLLSHCQYGIKRDSDAQFMYMTFDKLQLATDHCIQIEQLTKNGTDKFTVTGSNLPNDMFYQGDALVQFNSGKCNITKVSGPKNVYGSAQGFVMNVTTTDCGGIFKDNEKSFESGVNKSMCIYKISVPPKGSDDSVNVISFNVKQKEGPGNYKLTVYDGSSMRSDKLLNLTGPNVWSRTNELIFVYEVEDPSKPASIISVDYKTESCNKTFQCANKICMHVDWLCNGINDCGDFTDERNCESVPTPPVKPVKTGISGATFGVCSVAFFVVGILLAIFIPKGVDKFRNTRYHQFRDVSVVE